MKYLNILFLGLIIALMITSCKKNVKESNASSADTTIVKTEQKAVVKHIDRPANVNASKQKQQAKAKPARSATEVRKTGIITKDDLPRYIQALKPRIQRLYKSRSQVVPMQGSLKITVVFADNGDVESADIEKDSDAQFTDSFVSEVKEIVKSWHLDVVGKMSYSFRMSFYQ